MNDLISRKELIETLRKDIKEKETVNQSIPFKTGMIYRQIEAIKIIEEQPTVEAVPVVHGEWIAQDESLTKFMCSICNGKNYGGHEKFCPECGADMRKKVRYVD